MDAGRTGAPFVAGIQTLLPGARIPVHRQLDREEVLFVHKGQGRATLEGRTIMVVPGVMLSVPRNAWYGLRNTGTGNLQIVWTVSPAGMEGFFREYARLGGSADAASLQALAQRYGIELRSEAEAAPPAPQSPQSGRPHRGRRRHRRRGSRGSRAQPQQQPQPPAVQPPRPQPAPVPAAPKAVSRGPSPATPRGDRRRRQHRGRVKEVYMGGRWMPVSGEGPVIAE